MTTTVAMMWLEIGDWRADWIGGCYHISVAASEIRWAFKFQHAQCHLGCFEAIDFVLLLVLFYIDACACWCPRYVTIDGPAWQVLFIGIYWHNPKRMTNHHLIIIYWLFKHQYQNINHAVSSTTTNRDGTLLYPGLKAGLPLPLALAHNSQHHFRNDTQTGFVKQPTRLRSGAIAAGPCFIFHLSSSISLLHARDRTQETNKQTTNKRQIFIVATTLFIL